MTQTWNMQNQAIQNLSSVEADGNITSETGNIAASAGSVSAATTVTGGTGVVATTGNVSATAGKVTSGTDVEATRDVKASRHYLTAGTVPTAAAGAQAGTTPPAPVVAATSNDIAGGITFGTGASSASGEHVVVTFAAAFAAAPKAVILEEMNTGTEALGLYISAISTTGFSVSCTANSADSQANTVYGFYYLVIG